MFDELRRRGPKIDVTLLDPQYTESELQPLVERAAQCPAIAIAAFVTAAAYRGDVALAGVYPWLMERLLAQKTPIVFAAMGNPYLLRAYPGVAAYIAAFSTASPSEVAVVKALFNEIQFQGKLPVTIPGLAAFGAGLRQ